MVFTPTHNWSNVSRNYYERHLGEAIMCNNENAEIVRFALFQRLVAVNYTVLLII